MKKFIASFICLSGLLFAAQPTISKYSCTFGDSETIVIQVASDHLGNNTYWAIYGTDKSIKCVIDDYMDNTVLLICDKIYIGFDPQALEEGTISTSSGRRHDMICTPLTDNN